MMELPQTVSESRGGGGAQAIHTQPEFQQENSNQEVTQQNEEGIPAIQRE